MNFLNPWLILGALLLLSGATATGYWKGSQHARNKIEAQVARDERIAQVAYDAALQGTAAAIAKIEVKHTTIRQKAEVITREQVVYRDCVSDPVLRGLLDAARENRASPEPSGNPELPVANAGTAR